MLRNTVVSETSVGVILRWLHLMAPVYPEYEQNSPWVKLYSKIAISGEKPFSQVDNDDLQANLRRLRDIIQSGNDTHHATTELYRVYSEFSRRRATLQAAHDGGVIDQGTAQDLDIEADIEADILRHIESPSTCPKVYSDGTVICDWYGENDAANPLNWTSLKKLYVVATVVSCTFVVYLSGPIWVPGEEAFRKEFGTDYEYTALGLALFV